MPRIIGGRGRIVSDPKSKNREDIAPASTPAPASRLGRKEWMLCAVIVTSSSGGFSAFTAQPGPLQGLAGYATFFLYYSTIAISLYFLFRNRASTTWHLTARVFVVVSAIPVAAFLSQLWSINSESTLTGAIRLAVGALIGVSMARGVDLRIQPELVWKCLIIGMILSAIAAVIFPDIAVASDIRESSWQGIYSTKNVFGRISALAIFAIVVDMIGRQKREKRYRVIALAFSLVCLFKSGSAFGLAATLTVALILAALYLMRHVYRIAFPVLIAVVLLFLETALESLSQNISTVAGEFQRDPTLTGRTDLWNYVIEYIRDRPILGYGYSAFWNSSLGDLASAALGFKIVHAHNGSIEMMINLGIIGLLSLYLLFCTALTSGSRERRSGDPLFWWPPTLVIFVLVNDLLEVTSTNGIFWALLIAVACSGSTTRRAKSPIALSPDKQRMEPKCAY